MLLLEHKIHLYLPYRYTQSSSIHHSTMGLSASKFSDGGTLRGAFAPPLPGIVLPERLDPVAKTYSVTVPDDKGPGDKMTFVIKGHEVSITIPIIVKSSDGSVRKIRSGISLALYGETAIESSRRRFPHCLEQWSSRRNRFFGPTYHTLLDS